MMQQSTLAISILLLFSACCKEDSLASREDFAGTWQETTYDRSIYTDSLGNPIDTIINQATLALNFDGSYQVQNERFFGIGIAGTWDYQASPEQLIFYQSTGFPVAVTDTIYWKILSKGANDFTVEQKRTLNLSGQTPTELTAFRNFVR